MNPKVIIIILNWNGYADTLELIDSLGKITYPSYHILIVDNNSRGNDVEHLKAVVNNRIQVIECEENLGFAGGNNIAIKMALKLGAEFVLLINNDTIVEPDFLDRLILKITSDSTFGITAPVINYYDDTSKIWSAGGKISRFRGSGFAISNLPAENIDFNSKRVNFVSGCCMLIRCEVFERVGLFDENYFLYIEDTDLCYRTVKSGFQILVVPQSRIYHKVAKSTREVDSTIPLYYATRNRLYFTKKNFPLTYYFSFLYIFITMLFKSIYWLIRAGLKKNQIVRRAFNDFLLGRMGKLDL